MDEEPTVRSRWSPEPSCSCTNGGKPTIIDGVSFIFWDPSCRVHQNIYSPPYPPASAERIVGSWIGREREK